MSHVDHIGGVTGIAQKPTPFLCLAFKMLQLSPEREIVLELLGNEEFKLGCSLFLYHNP